MEHHRHRGHVEFCEWAMLDRNLARLLVDLADFTFRKAGRRGVRSRRCGLSLLMVDVVRGRLKSETETEEQCRSQGVPIIHLSLLRLIAS